MELNNYEIGNGQQTANQTQSAAVQPAEQLDSRRLAIFAKKEQAIQAEREKFKQEQESFNKTKEEVLAVKKKADDFDALRKSDPVAAMKMLGFTETEIFNFMAAQEKTEPTPEEIARKAAQEETEKFRKELEERELKTKSEADQAAIKQLRTNISEVVKTGSETLKFCSFRGPEAEEQIYEIIVANLKENGVLLSPEEAAKDAEELYKAEWEEMNKYMAPAKVEEKVPEVKPTLSSIRTLTNRATATGTALNSAGKLETPSEKRARLAATLKRALGGG